MPLTIGMVTIGQSPRPEITTDMRRILGKRPKIIECGALDALSPERIKQLAPGPGCYVLVSRLRDGTEVMLDRDLLLPHMQGCIDRLENQGADLIVILCTGEFPEFSSRKPLFEPSRILFNLVNALMKKGTLGVMVPSPDQIPEMTKRWKRTGLDVFVEAASPYSKEDKVTEAAENLKQRNVDLIIMDCMGYDEEMTGKVKSITGKPVVCPHSLTAMVVKELI